MLLPQFIRLKIDSGASELTFDYQIDNEIFYKQPPRYGHDCSASCYLSDAILPQGVKASLAWLLYGWQHRPTWET